MSKKSKICNRCNKEKSFDEFYNNKSRDDGKTITCKECLKSRKRKLRQKRQKKISRLTKQIYNYIPFDSYHPNLEVSKNKVVKFFKNNNLFKCKRCSVHQTHKRFYKNKRQDNGLAIYCIPCSKEMRKIAHTKRMNRPRGRPISAPNKKNKANSLFRENKNINSSINGTIARNGSENEYTNKYLGCSIEEARQYLEDQFEEGMSWENHGRGSWQIDHIIPFSFWDLSCEYQRSICFHYSNLQPLWAEDNLKKMNNIPNLFEEVELDKAYINLYKNKLIKEFDRI